MRNFIDDLVISFELNENVLDASFGYLYNEKTKLRHLFLAIGLFGDEEKVKSMTWFIKSKYYPDSVLNFASGLSDTDLYTCILSQNFTFYEKGKEKILERKVMQYAFEPLVYKEEVLETIRSAKVVTLLKDLKEESSTLNFQTYSRESREFIPLFTDKAMMEKSGMLEVPEYLTPMEIDFEKLNDLLKRETGGKLYVLNPGTMFEVEFLA